MELSDQVWAALMASGIDETTAVLAWWIMSNRVTRIKSEGLRYELSGRTAPFFRCLTRQ